MTRKKLNLAYISNDSMRKATFAKRKKGFVKKLNELSVLCGLEACAVIYSPFTSNPELWPSISGVRNVVEKFEMLPEIEKEKKMVNHEGFLRQSITKTMENITKKGKDNVERTMKEIMFLFLSGKENTLTLPCGTREDLCKYIDQYLKELYHHKSEILNHPYVEYGESSSSAAAANVMALPTAKTEVGSSYPDVFNSSHQLGNELWGLRPEQVNAFGNNPLLHAPSEHQQGYFQMMNPHPNLYFNQHQHQHQHLYQQQHQHQYQQQQQQQHQHQYQQQQPFVFQNVAQDGIYNPNPQEEWLDDKMMMNHDEQMCFPTMDNNNHYYHQRP